MCAINGIVYALDSATVKHANDPFLEWTVHPYSNCAQISSILLLSESTLVESQFLSLQDVSITATALAWSR